MKLVAPSWPVPLGVSARIPGARRTAVHIGMLFLLAVSNLACEAPEELSNEQRPGRRGVHRLVVVGMDGATWDVIDPMITKGELPHFAALRDRGVYGDLISLQPLSSPVVWTTLATGRFPREHHILDHVFPYSEGGKRPVVSTLRKAPALWNIVSHFGGTVGSVGWFVTHPPEKVDGFMVSDRASQDLEGSAYPPEIETEVQEVLATLQDRGTQEEVLGRFISWDYDRAVLRQPSHPRHRATQVVANRVDRRSLEDEFVRRMVWRLLPRRPNLFLTYFRMVDHASHAGWLYYDARDFEDDPDPLDRELLQDLIPASYRFMDQILGEIVELAGSDANIVVLSDHGFGSATGSYAGPPDKPELISGNHRPDGIVLAAGPDIGTGTIEGMTIVDTAPTLLALLGLPISSELPGRVVEEVLKPGFLERRPIRTVPSYGVSWEPVGDSEVSTEADEESLTTLRSLGYIGANARLATSKDAIASGAFWDASERLVRRAVIGEMVYHLLRGQVSAARALRYLVEEHSPSLSAEVYRRLVAGEIQLLEDKLGRQLVDPGLVDDVFNEGQDT